ncbi:MAG: hypothetical protein ACE37F_17075 [Nannocystaceae bacterium]|nr:hypothetical protein [bacterium]
MRSGLSLLIVGLLGCTPSADTPVSPTQAEPEPESTPEPKPEPKPEADPEPTAAGEPTADPAEITVLLTAATLADECGSGPTTRPRPRPMPAAQGGMTKPSLRGDSPRKSKAKRARRAARACKQSSIQLAVTAGKDAPSAKIVVKSVELLLADGTSLGTLQTRSPSVWSDGGYAPWDEAVQPGQDLSVSYAITQPDWSGVQDRRSQTYTMKAVVAVDGTDKTLQQNVVLDIPTSLPPGVKT